MPIYRITRRVVHLVALALLLMLVTATSGHAAPPISYQETVVAKFVNSSGGTVLYDVDDGSRLLTLIP